MKVDSLAEEVAFDGTTTLESSNESFSDSPAQPKQHYQVGIRFLFILSCQNICMRGVSRTRLPSRHKPSHWLFKAEMLSGLQKRYVHVFNPINTVPPNSHSLRPNLGIRKDACLRSSDSAPPTFSCEHILNFTHAKTIARVDTRTYSRARVAGIFASERVSHPPWRCFRQKGWRRRRGTGSSVKVC